MKDDLNKTDFTGIPWESLEEIAKVFKMGEEKYSKDNWRGLEINRFKRAILRHVIEYASGYEIDKESKLHHLAHIASNAMIILSLEKTRMRP